MYLTEKEQNLGSLIAKTMHLKTFTVRQNSMVN